MLAFTWHFYLAFCSTEFCQPLFFSVRYFNILRWKSTENQLKNKEKPRNHWDYGDSYYGAGGGNRTHNDGIKNIVFSMRSGFTWQNYLAKTLKSRGIFHPRQFVFIYFFLLVYRSKRQSPSARYCLCNQYLFFLLWQDSTKQRQRQMWRWFLLW